MMEKSKYPVPIGTGVEVHLHCRKRELKHGMRMRGGEQQERHIDIHVVRQRLPWLE